MLLAAGLSPAWQQILVFDSLRLGEVNRAREAHWCASGKVLNVGLALHRMAGSSGRTLSLLGGPAAAEIEREFAAEQISRRWVPSKVPTRVCTTVLDRATGVQTELIENAQSVDNSELDTFEQAFAEEVAQAEILVLTGSLPAGAPSDYLARLLGRTTWNVTAASSTRRAILDFRGPSLLAALPSRPFLVKPNREELAQTFGHSLETDDECVKAARKLIERGAQWALITDGPRRAWLASESETWSAQPPKIEVVNPIGCGDSLAAGVAWGLGQGFPVTEAFRLGLAAAAENAKSLLPARLTADTVRATAANIAVIRV